MNKRRATPVLPAPRRDILGERRQRLSRGLSQSLNGRMGGWYSLGEGGERNYNGV